MIWIVIVEAEWVRVEVVVSVVVGSVVGESDGIAACALARAERVRVQSVRREDGRMIAEGGVLR